MKNKQSVTQILRVVTQQNSSGKSVLHSVVKVPVKSWPAADAGDAIIWSTPMVPADNSDRDLKKDRNKVGMTLENGSVFRVTELGPGFETPMHRTLSIDYGVVLAGELETELDSGEVARFSKGDVFVHRGTNHLWRNPSGDTKCMFAVCMIESKEINHDGKTLRPTPVWKIVISSLWSMLKKSGNTLPSKSNLKFHKANAGQIRKVITAHNNDLKAVIVYDKHVGFRNPHNEQAGVAKIWQTSDLPASNTHDFEKAVTNNDEVQLTGSSFVILELKPGVITEKLISETIDYCIIIEGEVDLILDNGESTSLKTGDTVVQRGTSHAWRNPGQEINRIAISSIKATNKN